jgi:(5-formylfuran-3-yl)methyl phosphate synthase
MQLLISVKNSEEALLALHAGADVIDLKDPSEGALGALDLEITAQILQLIDGRATLSATVGERHVSQLELLNEIEARASIGVDIVKIAVDKLFYEVDFFENVSELANRKVKLVALFFAEESIDMEMLSKLKKAGFYGAMLDTKEKHHALPEILSEDFLKSFIGLCDENQLFCGVAGSLKTQHIDYFKRLEPAYIGFRGGVCENCMRISSLIPEKVLEIKKMLLNHNKINGLAQKGTSFALHSKLNMRIVI